VLLELCIFDLRIGTSLVVRVVEMGSEMPTRGRPPVEAESERLVVRMARENPSWGYDRIAGAMANLGYQLSDQTVAIYSDVMIFHRLPSGSRPGVGKTSSVRTWQYWWPPTSSRWKCLRCEV
jgi:hypothetical protein